MCTCKSGCEGGLCQYVFALLMVLEHCSGGGSVPGPDAMIGSWQSWGPQECDVEPGRVMDTVVERVKEQTE